MKTKLLVGLALFVTAFSAWAAAGCPLGCCWDAIRQCRMPRLERGIFLRRPRQSPARWRRPGRCNQAPDPRMPGCTSRCPDKSFKPNRPALLQPPAER